MIKSMTGFGRGVAQDNGKEFMVEIKTVNHRYSDVFIKMPRQLSFLEDKVREMIAKTLSRGKIDVFISYTDFGDESVSVILDEPLANAYIKAVKLLKDKYELKDDISVSLVSRFPDILKIDKPNADEDKLGATLKEAVESALVSLVKMREQEGLKLKSYLLERTVYIEHLLEEIELRAPNVVVEYKQRLEIRIKELLNQQIVDDNRIAVEVAMFADKCSIDEEITRLNSHLNQMRATLEIAQPIGRKLDFIIQEMNRETNTIGSKANDLEITRNVVEIKSEIEKLREQVQNIE